MTNRNIIEDHEQYSIISTVDKKTLVFDWKSVAGLSIQDFREGIAVYANRCKEHMPALAVIDARKLVPDSPALHWVSARKQFAGVEDYTVWWSQEILPIYHESGISGLAVATGNPDATGETAEVPAGVHFRMGYFTDLESAMQWEIN